MDWFLITVVIVMTLALLFANVYILIYFTHPDDKNTAVFPKLLVVFGLLLAEASVLLLPLDVANNTTAVGCDAGWNPTCGGLDMELLWLLVFLSIVTVILLLIPFATFYYEASSDSDDDESSCSSALCYQVATLIVIAMILVICFTTMAVTEIPITSIRSAAGSLSLVETTTSSIIFLSPVEINSAKNLITDNDVVIQMDVSFPIYVTALMSFIGWFAFTIFGSIGIIALPLDLILSYAYRPKFMPADIYASQKILLQRRVLELLDLGRTIKSTNYKSSPSFWKARKEKRSGKMVLNEFKAQVYLLERDLADLKACHTEYKSHNPLIPIFKLVVGILGAIITLLWLLQISLVMLPNDTFIITNFLSEYFMTFDKSFPLFGTISVGLFSMYLLAAVVKGCFKFGMRCFVCSLHPMEINRTYMSSFLFNLALILLCCVPVLQFCVDAFTTYTRLTAISVITGTQMRYLWFFSIFWANNVFVYAFLAIAALTVIYLSVAPRDDNDGQNIAVMKNRILKAQAASRTLV